MDDLLFVSAARVVPITDSTTTNNNDSLKIKRWTDEEERKILEYLQNGQSFVKIAPNLDRLYTQVYRRYYLTNNTGVKEYKDSLTAAKDTDVLYILECKKMGQSMTTIAKAMGRDRWDYCRTVIEEKNNNIYDTAQQKCKEKETEDLSDRVLRNKKMVTNRWNNSNLKAVKDYKYFLAASKREQKEKIALKRVALNFLAASKWEQKEKIALERRAFEASKREQKYKIALERVAIEASKREQKEKIALVKVAHPLEDDFYRVTMTKTSFATQEKGPGRNSIASGMVVEGSVRLEILVDLEEYQKLRIDNPDASLQLQDIQKCTIAIPVAPINHPRMPDLKAGMINSLTCEKTKVVQLVNHSLLEDKSPHPLKMKNKNHANHRPKSDLNERYDNVAKNDLDAGSNHSGSVIHAASIFRCSPEKQHTDAAKNLMRKMTDKELMVFLGEHRDSHSLPSLFVSYSEKDSYVYYTLEGKLIARLRIPAGFSIVYTVEIHSGRRVSNPIGLKHFSASDNDRLMFRIIHEAPKNGVQMKRTREKWFDVAMNALTIFKK